MSDVDRLVEAVAEHYWLTGAADAAGIDPRDAYRIEENADDELLARLAEARQLAIDRFEDKALTAGEAGDERRARALAVVVDRMKADLPRRRGPAPFGGAFR